MANVTVKPHFSNLLSAFAGREIDPSAFCQIFAVCMMTLSFLVADVRLAKVAIKLSATGIEDLVNDQQPIDTGFRASRLLAAFIMIVLDNSENKMVTSSVLLGLQVLNLLVVAYKLNMGMEVKLSETVLEVLGLSLSWIIFGSDNSTFVSALLILGGAFTSSKASWCPCKNCWNGRKGVSYMRKSGASTAVPLALVLLGAQVLAYTLFSEGMSMPVSTALTLGMFVEAFSCVCFAVFLAGSYVRRMYWVRIRKAADQGYADAQFALGKCYHAGRGLPQDFEKAYLWYEKAANQGDMSARFFLGELHAEGWGVQQNWRVAFDHFEAAAGSEGPHAMLYLAYLLWEGPTGIVRDPVKAHHIVSTLCSTGFQEIVVTRQFDVPYRLWSEVVLWFHERCRDVDFDRNLGQQL
jgi:hypothetical protein